MSSVGGRASPLLGLVEDRQGDRVVELPLGRRGVPEDPLRTRAVGGDDPADLGPLAGQRAGLVEEDGVDLVHQLQRPAVLDEDALVGAQGQRAEHRQRRGHPDAGAEVAVEDRDRAGGPHRRHAHARRGQGRDHRLVGQPLALVLRGQLVAGRVVEDLADLGRGRLAARLLDRDIDLAGDHEGRGEDPVADALLGRRRLAGQGVLIDHRHPLDDVPVHRHDLAGVDDDDVALLEPVHRDLDLGAVAVEPDVPRLLAEGVQQQLLRVVLRPLDQDAAEAQAPAEHRAGEDRHGPQAADDHDRVEHVDPEPLLFEQDLVRLLEGRDRRVGEHGRGRRQQRRAGELGRRRDRQRRRAERQVEVELVEPRRVLGSASAASRISITWSWSAAAGRSRPGPCTVSELVLYLSIPRTLISSRSIAWQSSPCDRGPGS